jgi:hypothetical protein
VEPVQVLQSLLESLELLFRQLVQHDTTFREPRHNLTSLAASVSSFSSVQPSSNTEVFSYAAGEGDGSITRSEVSWESSVDIRGVFGNARFEYGDMPWTHCTSVHLICVQYGLI